MLITIVCVIKLAAINSPKQKVVFYLTEAQVSELTHKFRVSRRELPQVACEHVTDVLESERAQ